VNTDSTNDVLPLEILCMYMYLASLVVVSLRHALSSTAELGLSLERGRSTFSDTDLGEGGEGYSHELIGNAMSALCLNS